MDSFDFLMLHLLSYFFIFVPLIFIDKKSLPLLFPSPQTGKESVSISVSFSPQKKVERKQTEILIFSLCFCSYKENEEEVFFPFPFPFIFPFEEERENGIKKEMLECSFRPFLLTKNRKKRRK